MFANSHSGHGAPPIPPGQTAYTTPGSYSWTAPTNVTSVCVVAVGGGTSAGGGLGWKNNIAVVPGNNYTVVVGAEGSDSYFISTGTVCGGGPSGYSGGVWLGGTYTGQGGGNGGNSWSAYGGGGAGGYAGNGGLGSTGWDAYDNTAGTGGAGGGGCGYDPYSSGGGGVGILGQGANGAKGPAGGYGGRGGSGGANGGDAYTGNGGLYGGGCGYTAGEGWKPMSTGAVRIIWGAGRAFPSTNTGNV